MGVESKLHKQIFTGKGSCPDAVASRVGTIHEAMIRKDPKLDSIGQVHVTWNEGNRPRAFPNETCRPGDDSVSCRGGHRTALVFASTGCCFFKKILKLDSPVDGHPGANDQGAILGRCEIGIGRKDDCLIQGFLEGTFVEGIPGRKAPRLLVSRPPAIITEVTRCPVPGIQRSSHQKKEEKCEGLKENQFRGRG